MTAYGSVDLWQWLTRGGGGGRWRGRVRAHGARRSGDEARRCGWVTSAVQGPLHAQIGEVIERAITLGHLQPGDRLPPERELAGWFGVNRLTLRQALSGLEQGRLIRRAVGRRGGTFVAEPTVERDLSSFAGFSEQARRLGLTASALVLKARGDAGARPGGAAVSSSKRVTRYSRSGGCVSRTRGRSSSSRPASRRSGSQGFWESPSEVPSTSCWPNATMPVRAEPLKSSSRSRRTTMPPRLLGVARGAPLLLVERVAFDTDGRPGRVRPRDLFRGRPHPYGRVELRPPRAVMVVSSAGRQGPQASSSGGRDSGGISTAPVSAADVDLDVFLVSNRP